MNLIRHNARPLNELFEEFFQTPMGVVSRSTGRASKGNLALDISEHENHVIVRASLPGFGKEDVEIQLDDGVLTIKADFNEEHVEGEKFYRRERRCGSLTRQIKLPLQLNDESTEAELKDGVLTLRIPKAAEDKVRKISIN